MELQPTISSGTGVIKVRATKRCCYGLCKSDSRYADIDYMRDVGWLPFPKPKSDREKLEQVNKMKKKRKLPKERVTPSSKRLRVAVDQDNMEDIISSRELCPSCDKEVLVGIAPTGGISFLSNVFEGSISDKEIVKQSGLLELLYPGDLVIADRGFDIKEILQSQQVNLNIQPFLKKRGHLTPQEEILTKCIARVRIHVERAIERMKNFKIIGQTVPVNLKPMITQIVHVTGFLVNHQEPVVK
ncbi:uncharacterized protein [Macrobrachium rosenbergii]|uniref:uncharacterized protein n=1 Tax=Macrobrachium rosenbergii TaxID=79674 RepID=UPI0034D6B7D4